MVRLTNPNDFKYEWTQILIILRTTSFFHHRSCYKTFVYTFAKPEKRVFHIIKISTASTWHCWFVFFYVHLTWRENINRHRLCWHDLKFHRDEMAADLYNINDESGACRNYFFSNRSISVKLDYNKILFQFLHPQNSTLMPVTFKWK